MGDRRDRIEQIWEGVGTRIVAAGRGRGGCLYLSVGKRVSQLSRSKVWGWKQLIRDEGRVKTHPLHVRACSALQRGTKWEWLGWWRARHSHSRQPSWPDLPVHKDLGEASKAAGRRWAVEECSPLAGGTRTLWEPAVLCLVAEDIAHARRQEAGACSLRQVEAGNCSVEGNIVQVHRLPRLHEHWVVR